MALQAWSGIANITTIQLANRDAGFWLCERQQPMAGPKPTRFCGAREICAGSYSQSKVRRMPPAHIPATSSDPSISTKDAARSSTPANAIEPHIPREVVAR